MLVRFAGSGDAFGSGGRFQTCIWVQDDGQTMLIDCGASSLVALRSQNLDPGDIDAVLVTHLHGDHFAGIPFLILDAQFRRRTRPLLIAGPAGIGERLVTCMEAMFPGSSTVDRRFPVQVTELAGDLTPVTIGRASVSAAEVIHASAAPPLALRVRLGGKTVAYSGDTEWTDALLEVAQDADLFICEGYSFGKKTRYHLDYATLREHLPRIQARRIILTHMSADMLGHLADAAVPAAHDGLEIHL